MILLQVVGDKFILQVDSGVQIVAKLASTCSHGSQLSVI